MVVDPLQRLSPHFLVADFLGSHSVYSLGLKNSMEGTKAEVNLRLANAEALCTEVLEPILEQYGPLSVGYGYISPEVSRRLVKYQDPAQPSHHRFDLGAAADICVHNWVQGTYTATEIDPCYQADPPEAFGAPIMLAHAIDQADTPYSRLITYSESPFICIAVSAAELAQGRPRKAFYENRYEGKPKAKPAYYTYASAAVRNRELRMLIEQGLPHQWQGTGYPTYHGGGREQYHHQRVSCYTMLSDWLLDLQSIANGYKNIPSLNLDSVQDAIGAAGMLYDRIIDELTIPRMSILSGYVSHHNPGFNPNNDWREGRISFKVMPPNGADQDFVVQAAARHQAEAEIDDDGGVWVAADIEEVYSAQET
jgi:hypothetical protein